jgi:cytochrome c peroxidase
MRFSVLVLLAILLFSFEKQDITTPEQLGEQLFSDPILSLDSSISCASCHIPQFAFCDTALVSRGVGGSSLISFTMAGQQPWNNRY